MPSSKPKMTIPEIRAELHEMADRHPHPDEGKRLHFLADETARRPSEWPRAPAVHRDLTPDEEAEVREAKRANPKLSQLQLARRFQTGTRCISYALSGRRK